MLSGCLALSLLVHVGSVHTEPGFNNINPGLGISCAYTENVSFSSGVYYNSESSVSAYASAEYSVSLGAGFRAGVIGGVVTGYNRFPVLPTVAIAVHSPKVGGFRASVVLIPPTRWNPGAGHLVISREF